MVLDKLGKIEKKLRVLEGSPGELGLWQPLVEWIMVHGGGIVFPGSKLKNKEERLGLQVECLIALERWERAVEILKDMIKSSLDQWSYIQQYVTCQIKLCKSLRRASLESTKEESAAKEEEEEGRGKVGSREANLSKQRHVTYFSVLGGEFEEIVWAWEDLK